MKKYILIWALLFAFIGGNAQVIINPDTNQLQSSPSVLVEFGTQPKGLLLPWVTNTAGVTGAVAGTVVYDVSDKKVKYLKGGSGWVDLSIDGSGIVDTSLQDSPQDAAGARTIIGERTASAPGILVLDSQTKAMVLPKVAQPYLNIINPSAGMMVYDTTAKQLAVFNGTVWTFWKAGTEVVPTVTTATGRIWMDRNLGASRVATSSNDAAAYGNLYQWGRLTDGHEKKNSGTTNTLSNTDIPGNGNFINVYFTYPYDWRSPQNDNLWQGVNGINNPCPSGFRMPTQAEMQTEMATWVSPDAVGAFSSPLKLPMGGFRYFYDGTVYDEGFYGLYWTSTISVPYANYIYFDSSSSYGFDYTYRAYGMSVRCIKD